MEDHVIIFPSAGRAGTNPQQVPYSTEAIHGAAKVTANLPYLLTNREQYEIEIERAV
jgi:hypothetical protein